MIHCFFFLLFFLCFQDENAISVHWFFSAVFSPFSSLLHWKTRKCIFHGMLKKSGVFLNVCIENASPIANEISSIHSQSIITFEWCMFFILCFTWMNFSKSIIWRRVSFLDFVVFVCVCVFSFSISRFLVHWSYHAYTIHIECKMRSKYTFLMLLRATSFTYIHAQTYNSLLSFVLFLLISCHFLFIES